MVVSSRLYSRIASRKGFRRECRRVGRACQRGLCTVVCQSDSSAAIGEGLRRELATGQGMKKPPDRPHLGGSALGRLHPPLSLSKAGLALSTDGHLCEIGSGSKPSSR